MNAAIWMGTKVPNQWSCPGYVAGHWSFYYGKAKAPGYRLWAPYTESSERAAIAFLRELREDPKAYAGATA